MKILITHFYNRNNKGDAAILSVLICELKKVFQNSQITISTMEDTSIYKIFEGCPIIGSFISLTISTKYKRIGRVLNLLYIIVIPILWSIVYRLFKVKLNLLLSKELTILLNNIQKSELIIPVGGGYLRGLKGIGDDINYFLLLYPIIIFKILNKPVVLHSQSFGPFGSDFQKSITKFILNNVNLIITRESISSNLLKKLGINKKLIQQSVDAGFLFQSNISINLEKFDIPKNGRPIVGITVARKWLSNPVLQNDYENEIAKFTDYLIKKQFMNVVFIPQVTSPLFDDDDRAVARRVIKKIKSKFFIWLIEKSLDHNELKAIYTNLDFIVGTRFHSVIFSLTSYIPSIAIEYEHKTRGIMKDLNLLDWTIKIEDFTANAMIKKFNQLVNKKQSYIEVLLNNLPAYIEEAKRAKFLIKDSFLKTRI